MPIWEKLKYVQSEFEKFTDYESKYIISNILSQTKFSIVSLELKTPQSCPITSIFEWKPKKITWLILHQTKVNWRMQGFSNVKKPILFWMY